LVDSQGCTMAALRQKYRAFPVALTPAPPVFFHAGLFPCPSARQPGKCSSLWRSSGLRSSAPQGFWF
jgi:hypothetical protein